MKLFFSLLPTAVLVGSAQIAGATIFSSGTLNNAIPDNNLSGIQNTINVSSPFTTVQNVDVILNLSGISGQGFNGDIYAYLTHDSGFAILLNRVGRDTINNLGYGDNGFINVRFSNDGVFPDIHTYGGNGGSALSGGTYSPDGRNNTANGMTTDTRSAFLSSFIGTTPSGNWTLFVADANPGGLEQLDSWSLDITAVPEPVNVALGIFGGLFAVAQAVRYWKKKKLVAAL